MKRSSDSKPWVPIVIGVLGLLAAGMVFRQYSTSAPSDDMSGQQLASQSAGGRATKASNEPGGWMAQSAPESLGAKQRRLGAESSRRADSGTTGALDGGSEPDPSGGLRDSAGGRDAAERDFRDTDTVDVGGDAIPVPQHAPRADIPRGRDPATGATATTGAEAATGAGVPPASVPGQAAKPASDKPAAAQPQDAVQATDPAKPDPLDPNGPVFSLPLESSTQPDKGDTQPIIADGVTFDQNGARFSENSQIVIPDGGNVDPMAGTITFWILPDWAGDVEGQAWLVHLGGTAFENHIDIFKDLRYLRFLFSDDTGYESGVGLDVTNWRKGDRHMITATWGDNVTALYIDGESVGARDYGGELDLGPNSPLFLGTRGQGAQVGANSNISGFQIYTYALSPDQVAALLTQPAA